MDVDLYLLRNAKRNWQQLTCMLAGKAWPTHQRICIACKSIEDTRLIDEAMWSQPALRFIPHGIAGEAVSENAPVIIGTQPLAADILIDIRQLHTLPPECPSYTRILDIVIDDADARTAARERYKHYYRLTGQKPQTHEIA